MNYRRIHLDGYSYYLTLVTHRRRPLLIEHIDILRRAFALSKTKYHYTIDAIVVLPDHLHMIITPNNAAEYPKIVSHIKRAFVYGFKSKLPEQKIDLSTSQYRRKHSGIWQERYYEHTIRNDKDWQEKMNYICNNPVKHGWVSRADQWVHSSCNNRIY